MNSLNEVEYHNEISFYVNDKLYLKGEILIDDKHYCEGIITDNSNEYFIFGTFVKYKYLDLYVIMNDGQVYKYYATKGYLKYSGKYSKLNSDIVNDFYLKVRELNVDPRDYGNDNPMYVFLEKIKLFRNNWLVVGNNKSIYDNIVSNNNEVKEETYSMYSYIDNREKNFYGVQGRDGLIYFLENDKLKNGINKYLDETVRKMVGHPCLMLQINDFLSNLGFNIDECVLTKMPVCYKNMSIADMGYSKEMNFGTYGCLTEHTVSQCYSKYKRKDEELGLFFDYIIENHYTQKCERDVDDIYTKRLDYDTFDFVGAIEIEFFMVNDDSTKYRLLIDMYTGYALLYDGDTIRVYGINRGISKNLAKSYREMGLENVPRMFLMAMYGINPYDYSIIDKEYNRYCLTNLEEKLTETKFKRLFKEKVKLIR